MLPAQVAESYDRVAARWAGPAFDRSYGIEQHRRAICFALHRGTALDVGCGSSGRFLDLLASHGFVVEGLDLSSEMLRIARGAHPDVTFHQADICEWTAPTHYDLISAWDSIWHVPLQEQEAVLLKLCHALAPGGILIFTAGGTEASDEHQDEHMGVPMYHASLGVPRICSLLGEGGCILRHFEYDQHPQTHVYFIAQRAEPPAQADTTKFRTVLAAASAYFGIVFTAGFLLGSIRVPLLVPRIGARYAELTEMPLMFVAIFLAAGFVLAKFSRIRTPGAWLLVGFFALAMLVLAELLLAVALAGRGVGEYIASRDPISGSVYLGMLAVFAVIPGLRLRYSRARNRA